jgi:PAS domain S-box-containing protein
VELRDFFDNAADGVLVVDERDRVIYWNDSAGEILGYDAKDAIGKRCYDVLEGLGEGGTVVCGPDCTMKACAFRGEKIHNVNLLTTHKNGRPVWMNMSTMCARGFEGRDTVVVHMFRNVKRPGTGADPEDSEVPVIGGSPGAPERRPRRLTAREEQVLDLLGDGLTSKEIARKLAISASTARNHVQTILAKLGVHSRLEAVLWARERKRG